jgi:hypothetical protein
MAGRDDFSGSGASTTTRLFGKYHPHTYIPAAAAAPALRAGALLSSNVCAMPTP